MDIDIDISPSVDLKSIFGDSITNASMVLNNKLTKHPVGIYFQNIPKDPMTRFASIPYKNAQDYGYFKIDFLNLNVLDLFNNKNEIRELLKEEVDWSLLEDESLVKKLFQIGDHFDVVDQVKPKNIQQLADILALIRPGKKHLLDKYLRNKKEVRKVLYKKVEKHDMRKSHVIPYALIIVLQLNIIKRNEL